MKHYGMNMKRMARLLDVAKRINPKQFDMGYWLRGYPTADAPKAPYRHGRELACKNGALPNGHLCNTTACLAGWATTDRSLRKSGLRLVVDRRSFLAEIYPHTVYCVMRFGRLRDEMALKAFFGLNEEGESKLFRQVDYQGATGKRHMIREIKRVMAHPELFGAKAISAPEAP